MIRSIDWPAEPAEQALPRRDTAASAPGPGTGDTLLLFQALRQRLALAAGDVFSGACVARGDDPVTRMRATLLECVADLSHLHQMMCDEEGGGQVLEQRIASLQAALAGLRAELAGIQAGGRETRRRALHDGPALRPIAELLGIRLDRALREASTSAPAQAPR